MGRPATSSPSEWVERYGDYLFRYALLRLRDRSAAEDLVQETFLAALANRDSFSGDSSEATWLVGILKHKIVDHYRRQAREVYLPEGDPHDPAEVDPFDAAGRWSSGPTEWGGNPADLYRQKEFLDQFTRCLSGLSPRHADAFTLREIEGVDTGDICKVLNFTETNLWVILHRARYERQLLLIRETARRLVATEERPGVQSGEALSEETRERIRTSLHDS